MSFMKLTLSQNHKINIGWENRVGGGGVKRWHEISTEKAIRLLAVLSKKELLLQCVTVIYCRNKETQQNFNSLHCN